MRRCLTVNIGMLLIAEGQRPQISLATRDKGKVLNLAGGDARIIETAKRSSIGLFADLRRPRTKVEDRRVPVMPDQNRAEQRIGMMGCKSGPR
jgi:hypothetical protein